MAYFVRGGRRGGLERTPARERLVNRARNPRPPRHLRASSVRWPYSARAHWADSVRNRVPATVSGFAALCSRGLVSLGPYLLARGHSCLQPRRLHDHPGTVAGPDYCSAPVRRPSCWRSRSRSLSGNPLCTAGKTGGLLPAPHRSRACGLFCPCRPSGAPGAAGAQIERILPSRLARSVAGFVQLSRGLAVMRRLASAGRAAPSFPLRSAVDRCGIWSTSLAFHMTFGYLGSFLG